MKVNKAIVSLELVDESTGEVTEQVLDIAEVLADKLSKKRTSTKKKSSSVTEIEQNDEPILRLLDNKYTLTSGAIEKLGATVGESKIVIRSQKINKQMIPVIAVNDVFKVKSGNKLTLKGTVSFRGKANEDLSVYGSIFKLKKHPNDDNIFILVGDNQPPVEKVVEPEPEPEDIIPTEEEVPEDSINIDVDDEKNENISFEF